MLEADGETGLGSLSPQDPDWQRMKKPLQLLECIHVLLSGYVEDPSRVPAYDR